MYPSVTLSTVPKAPRPQGLGHLETCSKCLNGKHPQNKRAKLYFRTLNMNHCPPPLGYPHSQGRRDAVRDMTRLAVAEAEVGPNSGDSIKSPGGKRGEARVLI